MDIGIAKVSESIFGRVRVRIVYEKDRRRNRILIVTLSALAFVAILAMAWYESNHSSINVQTKPLIERVKVSDPVFQPENVLSPGDFGPRNSKNSKPGSNIKPKSALSPSNSPAHPKLAGDGAKDTSGADGKKVSQVHHARATESKGGSQKISENKANHGPKDTETYPLPASGVPGKTKDYRNKRASTSQNTDAVGLHATRVTDGESNQDSNFLSSGALNP